MQRGRASWRTDTLIRRALSVRAEEARWAAIHTLRERSTREVFERARTLCVSEHEDERVLGADILGQLGVPERAFPKEASAILRDMLLRSETTSVLSSALYSLGHSQDTDDDIDIALIASFKDHESPDVRHAVVFALLGHEDEIAINALICLSEDVDDETRDWAVFGLGAQIETDTDMIRAALWKRVNDCHHDTRWEAINGLAVRRDVGIRAVLIDELGVDNPEACWFQAAGESGDPAYLPALEKHLQAVASSDHVNEKWLKELELAVETIRHSEAAP